MEQNRCRNGMFGYEMTRKMMNFGEKCPKALHYTLLNCLNLAYELVFFNKECIMQHTLKKLTY